MKLIHLYLEIENAIDLNTCPFAHGYKGLMCQCRFEFGHDGKCKCFDKNCDVEWTRL